MYYHNADTENFAAIYGRLDRESLAAASSSEVAAPGQNGAGAALALLVLLGTVMGLVTKPPTAEPSLAKMTTEQQKR